MKTVIPMSARGFTLIELLLVIGLLAVLATAVVLIINPTHLLAQARDSRRLTELQDLNKAIQIADIGGISLGVTKTVYVSIPDASSTICASLGLPILPSGWSYACSSPANYRKVNGTGWLPINFPSLAVGSPLGILPIDPINTASSGNYYTYVTGGSWELTTILESDKYRDKAVNDGDAYPGVYNVRTSAFPLTPGIRDKGLAGYWKFDEASGTLYDSSGRNNNGTQSGGVTYGATGKVDKSLSFDGVNGYVDCGNSDSLNFGGNQLTLAAWINITPLKDNIAIVSKRDSGSNGSWQLLSWSGEKLWFRIYTSNGQFDIANGITQLTPDYFYVAAVYNGTDIRTYVNGNLEGGPVPATGTLNITSDRVQIGMFFGNYSYSFSGLIDEVRIYNRALSAAEISAIYNATK